MSTQDHLRAAFSALLKGDLEGRDRECALAEEALEREPVENFTGVGCR